MPVVFVSQPRRTYVRIYSSLLGYSRKPFLCVRCRRNWRSNRTNLLFGKRLLNSKYAVHSRVLCHRCVSEIWSMRCIPYEAKFENASYPPKTTSVISNYKLRAFSYQLDYVGEVAKTRVSTRWKNICQIESETIIISCFIFLDVSFRSAILSSSLIFNEYLKDGTKKIPCFWHRGVLHFTASPVDVDSF